MTEDLGYVRQKVDSNGGGDKTVRFRIESKDERVWATMGRFNTTTNRQSTDSKYGKAHDHFFRID
jgi:hypothetical protein